MFFFDKIGSLVEKLWKAQNYDERLFPMIAHRALADLPPHKNVCFGDVVQWGLMQEQLPEQSDIEAEFGQPPLTVFSGRDFRIEVLFWVHGIPAIHEHAFSGAFHVMHGSSIHSHWKFESRNRINVRLLLGSMNLQKAEILHRGDIRSITSGSEFIHTTFHLECPSVSVVVRTTQELDRQPQLVYEPPSIAFASQNLVPSVQRRAQILHMLYVGGRRKEYFEMMRHLLATSDVYAAFYYLWQANKVIKDEETRQNLLLAARIKHPVLVDALTPALAYSRRQEDIKKLRQHTASVEHQFVLAILMNVPRLDVALDLLRQEYPLCDPVTMVVQCISDLSARGLLGVRFNGVWLELATWLLSGLSDREVEEKLGRHYHLAPGPDSAELIARVREFWLWKPLFDGAGISSQEVRATALSA